MVIRKHDIDLIKYRAISSIFYRAATGKDVREVLEVVRV